MLPQISDAGDVDVVAVVIKTFCLLIERFINHHSWQLAHSSLPALALAFGFRLETFQFSASKLPLLHAPPLTRLPAYTYTVGGSGRRRQ